MCFVNLITCGMWIQNFHILEFVLYYYQNKIDMMYCNNLHGKRLNYSTVLAACIKCTCELIIFDQIPSYHLFSSYRYDVSLPLLQRGAYTESAEKYLIKQRGKRDPPVTHEID